MPDQVRERLRTVVEVLGLASAYLDAKGLDSPRLDAELLLGHVLGLARLELYLHHDRPLEPAELDRLRPLLRRRASGEPVAYLLGTCGFRRLLLRCDARALVPRPETEVLVELALGRLPEGGRLLDLGTGTGAIAIATAVERPDAVVTATDVSPDALALAGCNAAALAPGRVELVPSDLFAALGGRRFDVIVANLPYVADGDPGVEAGVDRFEPHRALYAGRDGLDVVRAALEAAPAHLAERGVLALELGLDQPALVAAALERRGYGAVAVERDLTGRERFVLGERPADA